MQAEMNYFTAFCMQTMVRSLQKNERTHFIRLNYAAALLPNVAFFKKMNPTHFDTNHTNFKDRNYHWYFYLLDSTNLVYTKSINFLNTQDVFTTAAWYFLRNTIDTRNPDTIQVHQSIVMTATSNKYSLWFPYL